ncbi:MAG: hypothetical protein AB1530_04210 [Candidatus Omnitrophota bacterium]
MDFQEIRNALKGISFKTVRKDLAGEFEAVVIKEESGRLGEKLEKCFGAPVWPAQEKLSSLITGAIEEYGGIMQGQTLYFWHSGSESIFAMLWPWSDGRHITLKLIRKAAKT